MNILLRGKSIIIDPSKSIGKGGEADVFLLSNNIALKVFKGPDHPDFEGLPDEQKSAELKIKEHQQKLPGFPKTLPNHVVSPVDFALDKSIIVGYSMMFVNNGEQITRLSEQTFRQAVPNDRVVRVFRNLYKVVDLVHKQNVVIGDFNDLNVLMVGDDIFIIDADSFQFGKFYCMMFTSRFLDPLLCNSKKELVLNKPYVSSSDWYAFSIMLMQSLLFVGPYGGVYVPKIKSNKIPHDNRPLHRITIFDPEVRYPKRATHFKVLPDDLLHYYHLLCKKDVRGIFPLNLLDGLRWTKCTNCGTEHARNICPECTLKAPAAIQQVTVIRGQVIATRLFKTLGTILFATYQKGGLKFLYHEDNSFKRENGNKLFDGNLNSSIRYRICGNKTLLAREGELVVLEEACPKPYTTPFIISKKFNIDMFKNLPIFDSNENDIFRIESGRLLKEESIGPLFIGDVLRNQTLFWVGSDFGFGFYRAGRLSVYFIFNVNSKGINDNVKVPPIRGQLLDSTCFFSKTKCWFFVSEKSGASIINRCTVINNKGEIEGYSETQKGDGSWLSEIRGKMAVGGTLFSATDEGIVRLEIQSRQIIQIRSFPDTESFVDSGSYIFPGKGIIYVVGNQIIRSLEIK